MVLYRGNNTQYYTNQQSTAGTSYIAQLYTRTHKKNIPYQNEQADDTRDQLVDTSEKSSVNFSHKNNTSDQNISILYNIPEKSTILETALSVDDKLNLIQNYLNSGLEKITIYILICIALLVIIAIKLYK